MNGSDAASHWAAQKSSVSIWSWIFLFTVGKEKVMKTFSNEYESTAVCKAKAAKAC